jgi:alkylation response protein AidB-like acyl-CoA dehydrogenase
LGASGAVAATYRDGRPELGVLPEQLRALLGHLDATRDAGLVLSACVQLATALPLLAEAGRKDPSGPAARAAAEVLAGHAVVALAATDAGPGSDLTALTTEVRAADEGEAGAGAARAAYGAEAHAGDRRDAHAYGAGPHAGDRRDARAADGTGTGTGAHPGTGLTLHGTKRWITNAAHADLLLVLARRRPGPHFTNFSWLLVPAGAPGVHVEPAPTGLFTGSGTAHVRLDGVRVAADAVIGGAGRGLPLFARHIAVERLAGGLWASAACHRALGATKRLLDERGLWQHDGVRLRFAAALVRARQLDALTAQLAPAITERHDHSAAALLKAAAGDTADSVLDTCAHLHGAEGFLSGGMQRQRAEAALFGIAGGSTETVLASVADQADRLLNGFDPSEAPR